MCPLSLQSSVACACVCDSIAMPMLRPATHLSFSLFNFAFRLKSANQPWLGLNLKQTNNGGMERKTQIFPEAVNKTAFVEKRGKSGFRQ